MSFSMGLDAVSLRIPILGKAEIREITSASVLFSLNKLVTEAVKKCHECEVIELGFLCLNEMLAILNFSCTFTVWECPGIQLIFHSPFTGTSVIQNEEFDGLVRLITNS
jgi:hypothetical protein